MRLNSFNTFTTALRTRTAIAGILAVFAVGSAAPAFAQSAEMTADQRAEKEAQLERLRAAALANPDDDRIAFTRAMTAAELGYTSEAIRALEKLTASKSGLYRAELELAVLYFKTGDFEKAKPLFESVGSAPSASPELKGRIDEYVTVIDRRMMTELTTGTIALGIAYQTNANGGIEDFADVGLDPSADEQDDFNVFASAALSHVRRIGDWQRAIWETNAQLYGAYQFDVDEVNAIYAETRSGVKFGLGDEQLDSVTLKPYVKVDYLFLGEKSYNLGAGGGLLGNVRVTDDLTLGLGYQYTLETYFNSDDRPIAEEREADEHQFTAQAGFKLSDETTITAKADYIMTNADAIVAAGGGEIWSSDAWDFSVRATHIVGGSPLPGTLPMSFSVGAAYRISEHDAGDMRFPVGEQEARDDDRYILDANVVVPFTETIGVTAAVSYTNQDSNVTFYDYDNLRAAIAAVMAF